MATLQLNKSNNFRKNAVATADKCTFLIQGSVADAEVRIAGGALVQKVDNVQPGNIATIRNLTIGTDYTYQITPP